MREGGLGHSLFSGLWQIEEESSRIVCRVDRDAVIIVEVFGKKSQKTPQRVIDNCRRRLGEYDRLIGG